MQVYFSENTVHLGSLTDSEFKQLMPLLTQKGWELQEVSLGHNVIVQPTIKLNGTEYHSANSATITGLRQEIDQLMAEKAASELTFREQKTEIRQLRANLETEKARADEAEGRAESGVKNTGILINAIRILSVYLEEIWSEPDFNQSD